MLSRRSIRAQEWLDSFTSLYNIRENKKNSYEIKKSRILELRSQGLKHREIAEIVDLDRTTVSKYLSANGVWSIKVMHRSVEPENWDQYPTYTLHIKCVNLFCKLKIIFISLYGKVQNLLLQVRYI